MSKGLFERDKENIWVKSDDVTQKDVLAFAKQILLALAILIGGMFLGGLIYAGILEFRDSSKEMSDVFAFSKDIIMSLIPLGTLVLGFYFSREKDSSNSGRKNDN